MRKNGAATALSCTVTDAAGAGAHICTASGSVSYADGDTIDIEDEPTSGTPTASSGNSYSIVANTNTGGGAPDSGSQQRLVSNALNLMYDFPSKYGMTKNDWRIERWIIYALIYLTFCGFGWLVFISVIAQFVLGVVGFRCG